MTGHHDSTCWRFAAASVTGQAHVEAGVACEDAWFCGQTDSGFAIGVVSDGAGSAAQGGYAAQQICAAFEDILADLNDLADPTEHTPPSTIEPAAEAPAAGWSAVLGVVRDGIVRVRDALARHAADHGNIPDDYLATLVCAVCHPAYGALVLHVGDGAATAFAPDGEALQTSQPENGEFLNQTYFLVEDEWEHHCRTSEVAPGSVGTVFLMTDGVTDLAYQRDGRILRPADGFFLPLREYLENRSREEGERGLRGMLDTDRARELVNDDKTILWMNYAGNGEQGA